MKKIAILASMTLLVFSLMMVSCKNNSDSSSGNSGGNNSNGSSTTTSLVGTTWVSEYGGTIMFINENTCIYNGTTTHWENDAGTFVIGEGDSDGIYAEFTINGNTMTVPEDGELITYTKQ